MNNYDDNICPGCGRHCHLNMPGCGRGEEIALSKGISVSYPSAPRQAPPARRLRSEAADINERLALNFRDIGHAQFAFRHAREQSEGDFSKEMFQSLSESEKQTLLPLLEKINADWETRYKTLLEARPPRGPHGGHGPHGHGPHGGF